MRTTLTLDDDVAARLEALRGTDSLKNLVNRALRAGLDRLEEPTERPPYAIEAVSLGGPARVDLASTSALLAAEDEDRWQDLHRQHS